MFPKKVSIDKDVLYLIDEKCKDLGIDRSTFIALCCTSKINVYCAHSAIFEYEVGL
jgi:hypothetical protein